MQRKKMVNAILIANDFYNQQYPDIEVRQKLLEEEGFIMLHHIKGKYELAEIELIFRES